MRRLLKIALLPAIGVAVGVMAAIDVVQREHAIRRNFPIVGRFRYWLEAVGPELRQYIVTNNNEEWPFSRDQRRWIYASAKRENSYFGFGTDNDLELQPNYVIVKHSAFPLRNPVPGERDYDPKHRLPAAKVVGRARGRRRAFRPRSIVNVSGMSFGSLRRERGSRPQRGARLADCLQNTGEGGLSRHHAHGGELIWQFVTGYFGARRSRAVRSRARQGRGRGAPRAAIEIKLSQGAKPRVGGMLPGAKVSREVADARGVPVGRT